ncbi:uncharacterized protein LOC116005085 isoform X2 [Ipomoea triloba]|uniref:uncharacterized protein LOC116005085 isoform X2 n=1 Tax=Ipomoea triloba TaxID=35885 RepID=UPI00125D955C|nr:uncharacterized protein LOC116005085 isoform X2 [Ipomoea triloba]
MASSRRREKRQQCAKSRPESRDRRAARRFYKFSSSLACCVLTHYFSRLSSLPTSTMEYRSPARCLTSQKDSRNAGNTAQRFLSPLSRCRIPPRMPRDTPWLVLHHGNRSALGGVRLALVQASLRFYGRLLARTVKEVEAVFFRWLKASLRFYGRLLARTVKEVKAVVFRWFKASSTRRLRFSGFEHLRVETTTHL